MFGEVQTGHQKKALHCEGGQSPQQAHVKVVMVPSLSEFKEHLDDTESYDLVLGSPVRSTELDSVILMAPFQLKML